MTARMHYSFAPECAVMTGAHFDADGQAIYRDDHTDQNPAGQLWERVAERTRPDYAVYPWKMLQAVEGFHRENGPAVCIGAGKYTGPILGRHVCGDHHSHGIIRAGERVR